MAYPLLLAKLLVKMGVARHLSIARRLLDGQCDGLRFISDRLLACPCDSLPALAYEL
ncbi:MAG: hypothetical protein ACRD36_01610 [Candidatus Acidiferrum sp.]